MSVYVLLVDAREHLQRSAGKVEEALYYPLPTDIANELQAVHLSLVVASVELHKIIPRTGIEEG